MHVRFHASCLLLLLACLTTVNGQPAKTTITFESGAKAIFATKCVACHGANSPQGGLDLRSVEGAMAGGKSGPSVVAGEAAKSLLIDKIVTGQMPPGKAKLSSAEVDQLRAWIDKGIEAAPIAQVREQDALPQCPYQSRRVVDPLPRYSISPCPVASVQ